MPKHSTTHADRMWRALEQVLRRGGASVEECGRKGIKSLWASDLPLSRADALAFADAVLAYGQKHGRRWTARMSPEGAPMLLTFVALDR